MNNNTQPYKPIGDIKFDEFNPVGSSRKNGRPVNRDRYPKNTENHGRLHAEYKRISTRMKEIENILGMKKDPKNPNPTRFGNEFRKYAFKNKQKQEKKSVVVDHDNAKLAEKEIVDTKKELGF
jgi:hypothetical protein